MSAVRASLAIGRRGSRELPVMAVNATPRSQSIDSYGADSGPSRGTPCRPGLRPIEASKAAVCYVRNTSTPAGG
jgi:hypothetical protein